MLQTTVTVGRTDYHLAPGQDIAALRRATELAVRSGGGLVDLVVIGHGAVSILVSPGLPLAITEREFTEDPGGETREYPFEPSALGDLDLEF